MGLKPPTFALRDQFSTTKLHHLCYTFGMKLCSKTLLQQIIHKDWIFHNRSTLCEPIPFKR